MKIHSDKITLLDLYAAAEVARVEMEYTRHGSRCRALSFDVRLTGESRRRPNRTLYSDEYAATWDQWGVFLAVLFDTDPDMLCGSSEKYAAYKDRTDFQVKTNGRFTKIGGGWTDYWPADAHGDHRFKFVGVPCEQKCTKCSAVQRWSA